LFINTDINKLRRMNYPMISRVKKKKVEPIDELVNR